MLRRSLIAIALVATTVAPARAQDLADYVAYTALLFSPQGAFSPLPTFVGSRSGLGIRYGSIGSGDDAIDSFGGSGRFGSGLQTLSLTAGVLTCEGCDAIVSVGGEMDVMLARGGEESARFAVGLRPAIGFAFFTGEGTGRAMAASLGAPISLTAGTTVRVTPFLVPGIGFGRLSGNDASDSGIRPMFGFGLAAQHATGAFGVSFGLQKVMIHNGDSVLGVTVLIGM